MIRILVMELLEVFLPEWEKGAGKKAADTAEKPANNYSNTNANTLIKLANYYTNTKHIQI